MTRRDRWFRSAWPRAATQSRTARSTTALRAGSDRHVGRSCLSASVSRMDDEAAEAERTSRVARWSDISLPPDEIALLQEIAALGALRSGHHEEPDVRRKPDRAFGIGVLFSGGDPKAKALAAQVLAEEGQRPLYRIDLSQVVSKYIGETESNLRRVFDAAEDGGAILVLDEADVLFGERSEVGDSRDADIDVAYLLERIENHPGLVILTTNRKSALDAAFIRRLRFVIDFPLPIKRPLADRAPTSAT